MYVQEIQFTWRRDKDKRNYADHGVTFEQGKRVFFDPHVLIYEDCIDAYGEMRYHALGYGAGERLLLVVFVDHSTGDEQIVHMISARKADKYEQTAYSYQFT